jgi:hypothetical protein
MIDRTLVDFLVSLLSLFGDGAGIGAGKSRSFGTTAVS